MNLKIFGAAVLFAGFAQSSFGAIISNGFFDISGTVFITNPESTLVSTPAGNCPANRSCVYWQDGAGTHNEEVDISAAGLPNGNIPTSIAGNDGANMLDLLSPPDLVGSTINVPDFMTFNNGGITTTLTLTYIALGIYSSTDCGLTAAVGQTCSEPGSMFNWVNNPPPSGQATATWVFEGTTNTPGVLWIGNFTSQFPANTPFQTVFSELSNGGYVENTFSGTITLIQAPEPGTIGLLAIGAGLVATRFLLRKRRSQKRIL